MRRNWRNRQTVVRDAVASHCAAVWGNPSLDRGQRLDVAVEPADVVRIAHEQVGAVHRPVWREIAMAIYEHTRTGDPR